MSLSPWVSTRTPVLFIAIVCMLVSGCASTEIAKKPPLLRFEFEEPQMGVPFRIVLFAPDETNAQTAATAAFKRIADLNAIMSDYETDSELSLLSRSSEQGSPWVPVSEELWYVLSAGQRLARQSDGAFDVTIGPCAALWRYARREKKFPTEARLATARSKVGFRNLELKDGNARLLKPGMRLDLGGIAKGRAADQALAVLRDHGFGSAFVAASGDIALGDPPPGESGWRVEITGYDSSGGPSPATVLLARCGIATSGDLYQRLEIEGVRYSHILNPFTCVGMTNHALATVIAPDCMIADMLATTCTIVPAPRALELADTYSAAVRIVTLTNDLPTTTSNRRFDAVFAKRLAGEATSVNHTAR